MKIVCYRLKDKEIDIRPAPSGRPWINETKKGFARRCLPLMIANAYGWQILAQDGCRIKWNGGDDKEDLQVETDSGTDEHVTSHFGHGILTFRVHGVLRTEPGINLWLTGPVNTVKDGVQPLSGLIETDWSPYSFTMNWQVTRKDTWIEFARFEPICQFFPIARGMVEAVTPQYQPMQSDSELDSVFSAWRESRRKVIEDILSSDKEGEEPAWQMYYFRGEYPDGKKFEEGHQMKVRAKNFK